MKRGLMGIACDKAFAGAARAAASLIFAAMLVLVSSGPVFPPAVAGDYGTSAAGGSRLVRIGLNKSIVIRLPGEARDVLVGSPEPLRK